MLEVLDFERELDGFTLGVDRLCVSQGETYVLLGPSGAGKSQFLRTLAGFAPLHKGTVRVEGSDVSTLPPEKRGISIIFQNPHLFPHLDVRQNIGFAASDTGNIDALLELLDLHTISGIPVSQLSGGQRQLVALARALATRPRVLLLDEPFSALDGQTRRSLIGRFRDVQSQLKTTCLLVTHNLEDCLSVAHKVGILIQGRLEESGTPQRVLGAPGSERVARFLGMDNIFSGEVRCRPDETLLSFRQGASAATFHSQDTVLHVLAPRDGTSYALVQPKDIILSTVRPVSTSALNILAGTLVDTLEQGAVCSLTVDAGLRFKVVVTPQSFRELGLAHGQKVFLSFKASAVRVYQ